MTFVMLLVYYLTPNTTPDPLPVAITTGIIAKLAGVGRDAAWVVALGIIVQLAYGAAWGALLALSTPNVTIGKAIAVSIGLWVLMWIFYVPMAGADVFAIATNPVSWFLTLIFHLIYGTVLGAGMHRYQVPLREGDAIA